jgi:hypothetical protein
MVGSYFNGYLTRTRRIPALFCGLQDPAVAAEVARQATIVTWAGSSHRNGSAVMLRLLGRVEDFQHGQPVPLTQPVRGLVQVGGLSC